MKRYSCIALAISLFLCCSCSKPYHWEEGTLLKCNGTVVGHLEVTAPDGIRWTRHIDQVDSSTFKVTYSFESQYDIESARVCVDFVHSSACKYWMIPSVSYNGNQWGKGKEPKGASQDGKWRTYSYHRTPIPGAVYSEGGNFAVATWSDNPSSVYDDFSCSVMPQDSCVTHRIIWPEEEMPVTYYKRDSYTSGWQRNANISEGWTKTISLYVSVSDIQPAHRSIRQFLKTAWNTARKVEFDVPSRDSVWNLGIRYFKESLWSENGVYTGFGIGLLPDAEDGWSLRSGYESGWCGQNISIGCSMLCDYLKNGDKESLDKGMRTLDCWAEYCPLPNGLFIVQFDDILDGGHRYIDGCNLGTTAKNFIEAASLASKCGFERPEYVKIACDMLDFVMADQREDGCYARGWTHDGECLEREGTVGCFIVPAMFEAYSVTGNQKYFDSGKKAYHFYVKELKRDGYTTAGALDTWCIDKESAITLLRSSLRLYEMTGEDEYLDDAVQTSYYLSTWLWHYDANYPEDDAFTVNGYHTCGATSVSVQHHHLDYYASLWIPEWIELSELTGDPQWREKADAVWNNCCQLISDGTLVLNGLLRPAGSQNEAYFENSWGFDVVASDNGSSQAPSISRSDRINNWLVAWPGAFRLETLRRIEPVE